MKKGSIVIVDDNKNVLNTLRILLANYFENIYLLSSPNSLLTIIENKKPDIALLDMNYSAGINTGNEGLFWLSEIRKINITIPIIFFTAYADIDLAIKSLKNGATDFIVKPWDNTKLINTLQNAYELSRGKVEICQKTSKIEKEDVCWGSSKVMQDLLYMIEKVAPTDANILITGENGTGKEMVAKAIHRTSKRSSNTLVSVDMGAITVSLFESELFGHVKGAFTDAKSDREGKFEIANKGTLFLDEIGNLDIVLQAKLLAVLQQRKVVKVGSNTPVDIDIRLVCATNANLQDNVISGKFREDLLYRINTIQLEIPSLRKRVEDIPELIEFFLKRFRQQYNKPNLGIEKQAVDNLKNYSWPGNIRELQHVIEKAVILSDGVTLKSSDFYIREIEQKEVISNDMTLEKMEKTLIDRTMRKCENNISAVAQELGITRPTLYAKLKKYGL